MDSIQQTQLTELTNTTFLDETPPVAVVPVDYPKATNVPLGDISEEMWNVKEMLRKPMRVATGTWPTTATANSDLAILGSATVVRVPYEFLNAHVESIQTNILKSYTFARYTPVFTFQLNSTKFYCGRLCFFYTPLSDVVTSTVTGASMLPHVFIDAGNSSPVTLQVSWFHPQSSFNQTVLFDSYYLGAVRIRVVSPLRAPASATPTVDWTMWMHLENVELHVPINPALTVLTPKLADETEYRIWLRRRSDAQFMRRYEDEIRRKTKQIDPEFNIPQGLFDGLGSLFSSVTDTITSGVSGFGKLFEGDFSGALDDFGGALDSGLSAVTQGAETGMELGLFDRCMELKYDLARPPQFSNMAYGIGKDCVTRLDITPFSQYHPNSKHLGGKIQADMDFISLCQRDVILKVLPWASTDTKGTSLFVQDVAPSQMVNDVEYTWLAWMAGAHTFWRGSIVFSVSVVATHFHAGRLMIGFSNGYTGTLPVIDETTNWPVVTVDLHNTDNREYEIVCPFNQIMPYLFSCTTYSSSLPDALKASASNGQFFIYVLNELEAPETVSSTIDIVIKVRAGDDFRLWAPRAPDVRELEDKTLYLASTANTGPVPPVVKNIPPTTELLNEPHAGEIEDDASPSSSQPVILQKGPDKIVHPLSHTAFSSTSDIRDLIRRYTRLASIVIPASPLDAENHIIICPVCPQSFSDSANSSPPTSMLAYYSQMYFGWSGSIRYKLLSMNNVMEPSQLQITYYPNYFAQDVQLAETNLTHLQSLGVPTVPCGYPIKICNLSDEHAIAFEIPYQSPRHFLRTVPSSSNIYYKTTGMFTIQYRNPLLSTQGQTITNYQPVPRFNFDLFIAAGDDFAFHFPRPPHRNDIAPGAVAWVGELSGTGDFQ
jgi:hypothetical protein